MDKHLSESGRIYLRPLTPEDVSDDYVSWFDDDTVTRFLESKHLDKEACRAYIQEGIDTGTYYMYGIFDATNDVHIGNLKIGPILPQHKISDMPIVVGNRDYWGKGIAKEAIGIGNKVAFEKYGIRKLSGGIGSGNIGSAKAYLQSSWVLEAILDGHYLIDGATHDRWVVSCFNPAFFPTPPKGLDWPF